MMREKCATLWQFDDDVEKKRKRKENEKKIQPNNSTGLPKKHKTFSPKNKQRTKENEIQRKISNFFLCCFSVFFLLPYLMLKATTVKRKEDLVKEQRRERKKERERERENLCTC